MADLANVEEDGSPDLFLATGDLTNDGSIAQFDALRSVLDKLPTTLHAEARQQRHRQQSRRGQKPAKQNDPFRPHPEYRRDAASRAAGAMISRLSETTMPIRWGGVCTSVSA